VDYRPQESPITVVLQSGQTYLANLTGTIGLDTMTFKEVPAATVNSFTKQVASSQEPEEPADTLPDGAVTICGWPVVWTHDVPTPAKTPACECGGDKVGGGHSNWCPKHE